MMQIQAAEIIFLYKEAGLSHRDSVKSSVIWEELNIVAALIRQFDLKLRCKDKVNINTHFSALFLWIDIHKSNSMCNSLQYKYLTLELHVALSQNAEFETKWILN